MKHTSKNSGFLAVEILVAVSIVVLCVLAAMAVSQKAISVSSQSLHATEASFLLEEGAEVVRIVRDDGWSNISSLNESIDYYPSFSGSTWTLSSGTPVPVGIFTRTVSTDSVNRNSTTGTIAQSGSNDPGTKLVTVTVSWFEGTVTVTKTMQFYITNIFGT